MLTYLDLKFVTINIENPGRLGSNYEISKEPCSGMDWKAAKLMRLFRYGRMIKYGGSLGGGVFLGQDSLKLEGMVKWLDKVTKPAVTSILDAREFLLKVEYNQVAVMGYFMVGI